MSTVQKKKGTKPEAKKAEEGIKTFKPTVGFSSGKTQTTIELRLEALEEKFRKLLEPIDRCGDDITVGKSARFVKKCKVLTTNKPQELENFINDYLAKDWETEGDLVDGERYYLQKMVKYVEVEELDSNN